MGLSNVPTEHASTSLFLTHSCRKNTNELSDRLAERQRAVHVYLPSIPSLTVLVS